MRMVLLTALALVLTLTGPAAGQDESPADEAIQEAITILEARKAQAEVRADQEKIAKAIAALEKYLAKDDPDTPKEPLKVTPTQLRKKLQARTVFNPKTNELTLVYDLSKPDQLKDFELNGAEPVVRGGVLRIGPADTITHVVQFETVSVTGQLWSRTLDWAIHLTFRLSELRLGFPSEWGISTWLICGLQTGAKNLG